MAQVNFHSMRLKFQKLKDMLNPNHANYYPPDQFANLIFQSQNADAPGNRDDYDLIGYVTGTDGSLTEVLQGEGGDGALIRDIENEPHRKNANKIALANYPIKREKIQQFVDDGGNVVDYLLLEPDDHRNDNRYVIYIIIPKNFQGVEGASFDDDQLNPCPPNQPG